MPFEFLQQLHASFDQETRIAKATQVRCPKGQKCEHFILELLQMRETCPYNEATLTMPYEAQPLYVHVKCLANHFTNFHR
jgi:hypothetical protein